MYKCCLSLVWIVSSTIVLGTGCVWVRTVDVGSDISQEPARLSGTPRETLAWCQQRLAPGFWQSGPVRPRVGVGPACLSREALARLTGDLPDTIETSAEAGASKAAVLVRSGEQNLYFYVERTSQEVQSIVVERLTAEPHFRVFALDDGTARALLDGDMSFQQMYEDGIRYYVDGTVVTGEGEQATRVHLRLTDTATREIVCSAFGDGPDLPTAARKAADALILSAS